MNSQVTAMMLRSSLNTYSWCSVIFVPWAVRIFNHGVINKMMAGLARATTFAIGSFYIPRTVFLSLRHQIAFACTSTIVQRCKQVLTFST